MKFFTELLGGLFPEDRSWAVKLMAIEYQKDYVNLQKSGINITPDVAFNYLTSIGDKSCLVKLK